MKKIIIIIIAVLAVGIGGALFLMKGEKALVPFNLDPGDYFVTDISGSPRLLKADLIISMADDTKKEFYDENNARLRSVIILTIRGKTEEDLKSASAQLTLAEGIVAALRQEFETEDFLRIYFNEFVIQ